jgi:hypothetical protein
MADDKKDDIIASSPLVKEHATVLHRIVIRDLGDEFVVHMQCFPEDGGKPYFHQGNYFQYSTTERGHDSRAVALKKAYTCADRRARRTLHIGEDT